MSCCTWESATIILPRDTSDSLRERLVEHTNTLHDAAFSEAVATFAALPPGQWDAPAYADALGLSLHPRSGMISYPIQDTVTRGVAMQILGHMLADAHAGRRSLHGPSRADVDQVLQRALDQATRFSVFDRFGAEVATITFKDGSVVQWEVPDENGSVGRAHDADLGRLFFEFLDGLDWPPGTGGFGVGNDDDNFDDEPGDREDYSTFVYGPLGAAAPPD